MLHRDSSRYLQHKTWTILASAGNEPCTGAIGGRVLLAWRVRPTDVRVQQYSMGADREAAATTTPRLRVRCP